MPVNLDSIGIQSLNITLAESNDISKKVDVKHLMDKDGKFVVSKALNPMFDFSIKGRGDLPAGFVLGTDGGLEFADITTGITMITSIKEGEKNDDWNTWEIAGKNFPDAE